MMKNDERREVARRLRSVGLDDIRYSDAICEVMMCVGLTCIGDEDCHGSDERPECVMRVFARLADLIEPCNPSQTVAEDMFGQMRHSTEQERIAYADMMARNSVELHQVDRDALLALADEIERKADEALDESAYSISEAVATSKLNEYTVRNDIARRIREALGVQDV